MFKNSFKQKFIFLLLVVSLIPTIFIGVISYEIGKTSLYERIELDLTTQASHVMDQIDRFLFERHNDTQLLISDSKFIDPDTTAEQKTKALKEYRINLGYYDNIHLLNVDGEVIASTFSSENYPNFSSDPWFKDIKKSFYYTSDIQLSDFSNEPTIFFANVILGENNEPHGVIVAELLWPVITDILSNVSKPAEAFLLNRDLIEIGGGRSEDILKKDWTDSATRDYADDFYLVTKVSSRGYLVYRGNYWKLILRTPVEAALAPLNNLFFLISLFVLGFVIVILVTGIIFGNKFVSPIKKLTQGAEEIKRGNWNQKIQVKSKDELGFLAITFNEMAEGLKQKESKLKREMKRERELERVKDEIWTTASHNLRSPLTGTNWSLEMLNKGMLGKLNVRQKDAVDQMTKNTTQLNYLVNILLDVAKMESGKFKLSKKSFYLEDLILNAIDRKKIDIKEKNLNIVMPVIKKKTKLMLDPDKTQQVFNVIIDNAIIYSNDKGTIRIKLDKTKKKITCSITDDGIGISKKDLKTVFGKFAKGENSETKNATGIGLGLYIAEIIVKSSRGKLWAESKLGQGSTFYIELPVA